MSTPAFSAAETTALVFIAGFAIQQLLTLGDPFVNAFIQWKKNSRPTRDLPNGMAEGDYKKVIMALVAFILGLLTVGLTGIRLLAELKLQNAGVDTMAFRAADLLVSALVLGSGTEAVNTVLKYLGYVKDARKPAPEAEISIAPNAVKLTQGETFQFRATVKNAPNDVEWTVLNGAGGSIDATGKYSAPAAAGTYQVAATTKGDPSKYSFAVVTVQ